jgi:sulfate adenylyltransferase
VSEKGEPPIPALVLGGAELDDLEMLLGGGYGPAARYAPPNRTHGWPFQPHLAVPADSLASSDKSLLVLSDPEGTPLGRLAVAEKLPNGTGLVWVGGAVQPVRAPEHGAFRRLRVPADQVRADHDGRTVVAGIFRSVPTDANLAALAELSFSGSQTLLLALVGHGSPTHVGAAGLVRAVTHAAHHIAGNARVVAVPLPAHGHLKERAASELRRQVAQAYGATEVLDFDPDTVVNATDLPASSARELHRSRRGAVVLFTGLSGSGKSTIARALVDALMERSKTEVTLLDGDEVRRMLSAGLGFSRTDRELNVRRIGFVASLIARHGGIAVCAPIAPFSSVRAEVRAMAQVVGGFVLVYVATPLEVCEARDRKGLYAQARAGLMPQFTGISDPYEEPEDADVVVDGAVMPVDVAVEAVISQLTANGVSC